MKQSKPILPYMSTEPREYLSQTAMMTYEQKGIYFELLNHLWIREASLPADDTLIARLLHITPAKWRKIKSVIGHHFEWENEKITHSALTESWRRVSNIYEIKRSNGAKGGIKRFENMQSRQANAKPIADPTASRLVGDVLERMGAITTNIK